MPDDTERRSETSNCTHGAGRGHRFHSRRTILGISGAALATGLAGCLGGDDDDGGNGGNGNGGNGNGNGGNGNGGNGNGNGGNGNGNGNGGSDWPEEDLQMTITSGSGGGFDTYGRIVAEHMPDHLPNDVDVVPENVTPSVQGISQVNNADPEGHEFGFSMPQGGMVAQEFQDAPFDMQEMTWLATLNQGVSIMMTAPDSGLDSVEDLQNADNVLWSCIQAASSEYQAVISANVLDIPATIIPYENAGAVVTDVISGEVDVVAHSASSTSTANALMEGDLQPIMYYSEEKPDLAYLDDLDIPESIYDYGAEELEDTSVQRMFLGPPDMPDSIKSTLETALVDTMESDEIREWVSEDEFRKINPLGSEETEALAQSYAEVIDEHRDALDEHLNG